MKNRSFCAALASLFLVSAAPGFAAEEPAKTAPPADGAKVYPAKDLNALRELKGQQVTVEGTITQSGENKSKTIRYLNFAKNYNDAVSLVFFVSKGGEAFALEKLTPWVGKKVRATGKLTEYQDRLQIAVEKLDQIQEVKEAAPAPEAK